MPEIKSGIVLYPEGEVVPNIARQLGIVTNTGHSGPAEELATVHAVAYDPEIVIAATELFYPDGLEGHFFPPFDDEGNRKLREHRAQLQKTAQKFLVENGLGGETDYYLTHGRRFDIIAPLVVNEAVLALGSIGMSVNALNHTGSSIFDESAHVWLFDQGSFRSLDDQPVTSGGSIDITDIRKKVIGTWNIDGRQVSPTSVTQQAYAEEALRIVTHPHERPQSAVLPSVSLESVRGLHEDVYTLRFEMPIGAETRKALEEAHAKYDQTDLENLSDYDSEGDLFGDYRPQPVVRHEAQELAAAIDPLENLAWQNRLN
jgi:hypothetical protein